MTVKHLFLLPLMLVCFSGFSQPKRLQAVKAIQAPRIDGVLDDSAWQSAPVVTGFIQNFPQSGQPASVKTEVKILYDDDAVYIGAMLFDDPSLIRKQLTSRDGEGGADVDYFSVFFDTYKDKQNGFQFLVTSVNVQTDAKISSNQVVSFREYGDKSWDAVWQSKTSMVSNGWIAEIKIPYISLRFAKKDVQDWGMQFLRSLRRNNETSFWNPVDPNVNGFVNQFGEYDGLKNIQPPLRLSFSPYVSGGFRTAPINGVNQTKWLKRGGMDLKYGINESFTVDATLIPDFGQVISDNVILNLSPFEVQFQENRPFFTEGTELFNKAGLFYSRRVGATPSGFYDIKDMVNADPNLEIIKNPSVSQLYNAVKFSGRNNKKLGIGIFNAVTAPTHAIIRDKTTNDETKIETSPLTNYNIFVLDQALKRRSYLSFTNTNVIRNGAGRDANVSSIDFSFFNKTNTYSVTGATRYSKIFGANPYDGFNTNFRFGKISGKWQYNLQNIIKSEKYDPNDLGILLRPNEVNYIGGLSYNQFTPKGSFITYSYTLAAKYNWLYKPYVFTKLDLKATAFWVFKNFWDVTITAGIIPRWEHNYFELRTNGRFISYPVNYGFNISGSSDSRKKTFVRYGASYIVAPEYDNKYTSFNLGLRQRFSNNFNLDLQLNSGFETNQLGYAFLREVNGDPIAGFRDNRNFESILSGTYNFTSRLNLSLRARHFWNKVNYISFHNVDANGYLLPTSLTGPDENFNVFNLDAFVTWDFRLGSRIILGWKNFLGDDEYVNGVSKHRYLDNLGETFNLAHGNEVTLRFIYYLDYNQLKKKH